MESGQDSQGESSTDKPLDGEAQDQPTEGIAVAKGRCK